MKKLSQKAEIRRYLEAGGHLTQKASRIFWECGRLASRIDEIKKEYRAEWLAQKPGDNTPEKEIEAPLVKTEKGAWVAQYSLKRVD